jgi:hypothetical protein
LEQDRVEHIQAVVFKSRLDIDFLLGGHSSGDLAIGTMPQWGHGNAM